MVNVTKKPFMLSVVILNVIMLSVVAPHISKNKRDRGIEQKKHTSLEYASFEFFK